MCSIIYKRSQEIIEREPSKILKVKRGGCVKIQVLKYNEYVPIQNNSPFPEVLGNKGLLSKKLTFKFLTAHLKCLMHSDI